MKRIILGIIPLLACLFFTGCKDDELARKVQEGLPTSLTFKMVVPKSSDVNPMTRASDEVETNVEKLGLIFYKYEGSKGQVVQVPTDNITKISEPSSTNYYYTITISAEQMNQAGIYTGEYANVFAIANWDKGFCTVTWNDLQDLTLAELKEYCVLKTNNQTDLIETALLLTGEYGKVTLEENGTTLSDFHLKRLTAKVTFNFTNGEGANFTPTEYEIHNYSRSSTLIERTGWQDNTGTESTSGTNPGNLTYKGKDDEWAFASTTTPFQMTGSSILFYMLENVQPAKEDITETSASWSMREKRAAVDNHDEFKYAPEMGTYVVVRGTYSGRRGGSESNAEEQVTGNVVYTIHLGDFSSDTGSLNNYTVRRNTKYNYNVTVTGVNSIIVEATTATFDNEPNPAAEGSIMTSRENVFALDAHFETVMLKLPIDIDVSDYTLLVNTPYGMFTHTRTEESEGTSVSADQVEWVKFGKPASATEFAAYPGDSKFTAGADAFKNNDTTNEDAENNVKLVDIYGLLSLLKSENSAYRDQFFVTETDTDGKTYYYVTAYVDENYYDDEKDFSKFVNVSSDRRMALSSTTSISDDRYSSYTVSPIFSLTQRPIRSPFDLGSTSTLDGLRFGVETVEETAQGYLTANHEEPSYPQNNEPRVNWGWRNLWEQVQDGEHDYGNNGEGREYYPWSKYINIATNGHFSNFDTNKRISAMNSDYAYGLYECFSRNRDENGDGYIDIQEMKWFLPAIQECTSIWSAGDALPAEARFNDEQYFTSTNNQYRVWWAQEGITFGSYGGGQAHIRCIRILGEFGKQENEITASISKYDSANRIVYVHDLAAGTTRIAGSQVGEYTNHNLDEWQNRLPTAFQIASKDLSYTSGRQTINQFSYNQILNNNLCATYYTEDSDGNDLGEWRIPNQRELTLMFRHYRATDGDLTGISNLTTYTVARTTYPRNEGNALYVVTYDSGNQFITTSWFAFAGGWEAQSDYSKFKVRCVRDVKTTQN